MNTTIENRLGSEKNADLALSKLLWVTPLVIAVATVANLALYAIAGLVAPGATAWPGAGWGQIIGASVVYLLIGVIVLAVVARLSSRPRRHYWIVATVGLLLSMVLPISAGMGYGPPGSPPAPTTTVLVLCLMHVVAYAVSMPLLTRLTLD